MPTLLETFASYVPTTVVSRHATTPANVAAPYSERFQAALLFADISGFTALTERLAQRGPAGAEDLSGILNSTFGQLVAIISAFGGDTVKFAGDALLAIWPVEDEDLPTMTQRAAECGLALQATLRDTKEAAGTRLSIRIGVGAGAVVTMRLGGVYGRWEMLVAGPALLQTSAAIRQAQPGEVVLAPEAWSLVQPVCLGTAIPSDPRLEIGDWRLEINDQSPISDL